MGQKRLEGAIAAFQAGDHNSQIQVEWKPYILNPSMTTNGEDLEEYCIRRWGSSSWINRLKQEGRKSGAPFENWNWACNTMKSHRLIKFANERYCVDTGKSNAAIFKALYEDGKNISLVDTLVEIGLELALNVPSANANELRQYLESDEGEDEVIAEVDKGKRTYKISGVPFFLIEAAAADARPYSLSGAQNKETFLELFQELDEV